MKIYLDLCAIQRPLDTSNQIRIVLELEAVLGIIALSDIRQVELLSSEALLYEGEQSSLPVRKEHTSAVLAKAKNVLNVTGKEKSRAAEIIDSIRNKSSHPRRTRIITKKRQNSRFFVNFVEKALIPIKSKVCWLFRIKWGNTLFTTERAESTEIF